MSSAAASPKASQPATTTAKAPRRSIAQELGLIVVVLLLGGILAIYGWQDAGPGRPNTFLNFDNLIDSIATPMSYYAIMAIGVTIVIITGGIDISVGSIMALAALGGAAALQNLPPDASAVVVLPIAYWCGLGSDCSAG
jgi:ribose/xylose/arabinose/galactoside ABC-type transport system permease subunit